MRLEQYNEIETTLTTENKFIVVGRCRAAVGNGVLKWLRYEIRSIFA
jgi:hypothetical protein